MPDGSNYILSLGLGKTVAVNTLIGMPTIKNDLQIIMDFSNNMARSTTVGIQFPIQYEQAECGLPNGTQFDTSEFQRPSTSTATACTVEPAKRVDHTEVIPDPTAAQ